MKCRATGCAVCTRFSKQRLKQTQQIIRWFLQRSGKANVSHSECLNPHSIGTTHELGRPKPLIGQRDTRHLTTHALPPSHGGKCRLPVPPRKTSRPPGGAAAPAPAPAPAPRPLGRAGPRPPPSGVTPSMQRGAPLPLPPLPLPGGEDGGGRRGGSGDPAHGRRGAAQNRPPQGRHLVREERGGSGGPARAVPPPPGPLGCRRDRPPSPRHPPTRSRGRLDVPPAAGKVEAGDKGKEAALFPALPGARFAQLLPGGERPPGCGGASAWPGLRAGGGEAPRSAPCGGGPAGSSAAAGARCRVAAPDGGPGARRGLVLAARGVLRWGRGPCYQAFLPLSRRKWPRLHLHVIRNDIYTLA